MASHQTPGLLLSLSAQTEIMSHIGNYESCLGLLSDFWGLNSGPICLHRKHFTTGAISLALTFFLRPCRKMTPECQNLIGLGHGA